MLEPVEKSGAGLAEIRGYFGVLLSHARKSGAIGCLMCNTASEVAPFDEEVARRVRSSRDRARRAFRHALVNARLNNEIGTNIDPASHADFLAGALQTIWLLARSAAGSRMIANHIAGTLATLQRTE
jgi:TetR/AcrR family transcriptional repressor of nem operon